MPEPDPDRLLMRVRRLEVTAQLLLVAVVLLAVLVTWQAWS